MSTLPRDQVPPYGQAAGAVSAHGPVCVAVCAEKAAGPARTGRRCSAGRVSHKSQRQQRAGGRGDNSPGCLLWSVIMGLWAESRPLPGPLKTSVLNRLCKMNERLMVWPPAMSETKRNKTKCRIRQRLHSSSEVQVA